jgi:hypothetical protein
MDFIQHNSLATETIEKALGVEHHTANAGELTVKVLDIRKALAQPGLSHPPNASEPEDRPASP